MESTSGSDDSVMLEVRAAGGGTGGAGGASGAAGGGGVGTDSAPDGGSTSVDSRSSRSELVAASPDASDMPARPMVVWAKTQGNPTRYVSSILSTVTVCISAILILCFCFRYTKLYTPLLAACTHPGCREGSVPVRLLAVQQRHAAPRAIHRTRLCSIFNFLYSSTFRLLWCVIAWCEDVPYPCWTWNTATAVGASAAQSPKISRHSTPPAVTVATAKRAAHEPHSLICKPRATCGIAAEPAARIDDR